MPSNQYEKGVGVMSVLAGDYGRALELAIDPVAPGFARSIIEFGFGDICARPGLELKYRELATIAALTALGTAPQQLKAHIAGALNVGLRQEEIAETIVQVGLYAGLPSALNGLAIAKEVFAERAFLHESHT